VQVTDFEGSCKVQSPDELLARLRSVRRGDDGAFILDHGGPESLWLHVNGDAAFVWFCLDPATGRAGFVPDGMWAGERQGVRFRLVGGSDGDTIEVPWWQLLPPEVAYRAAVEYLHSPARPASVSWFEL
jgi:hypothetical protein